MYFLYDESGSVTGFNDGTNTYFYQKNIQGDIIRILDVDGNVVVEYTYDAWGKVLSITGTLADTIGQKNPFRYRSYYYDSETGWYYLNSRYYDPEVGRFINADDASLIGANGGIEGYNMFAYCNNNPILRSDYSGKWFGLDDAIAAGVGALVGIGSQLVSDVISGAMNGTMEFSSWETYAGAAVGGALGGVASMYLGPVAGAAISSGTSTLIGETLECVTGKEEHTVEEILIDSTMDAATGAIFETILPTKISQIDVPGITSGRNSMSAVYSSGLTKIRNKTASTMSLKVFGKGVVSEMVSGTGSTIGQSLVSPRKIYKKMQQDKREKSVLFINQIS